jgi:DNA (cytosine-5)-methyltransferase 1
MLTVGSLFSGIGGLDLGLERAGMEIIWQSEIDPYPSQILAKHWPKVPNYGDIKRIEWANLVRPNVICGGYPCQPFSLAGNRAGTDDPRHLWPWVREAIRELRPDYAILENVRGHLSMGFGAVMGDLADLGYDAEWQLLPASGLGAPHERQRVIIVAYPNDARGGTPRGILNGFWTAFIEGREEFPLNGFSGHRTPQKLKHWKPGTGWRTEPQLGRMAHGVSHRMDRIKSLGNAVVPEVAEFVGRLVVNDYLYN